ncbi:hypothetical protein [Streptomyces sp. NPDC001389]|uniref:hypothetical protein n=1 Tax=Streptomyces sp. NPDC001389 TaxID=3364569 RepID=UPI0036793F49
MTTEDRTQATALFALLAALFGALWALQRGHGPQSALLFAALAYGAALALAGPLQAPLGEAVATSAKYTGITLVCTTWLAVTGAHAGWQLLRSRGLTKGAAA